MNFLVIGGAGAIGKERIKALIRLREEGKNIQRIVVYDKKPCHEFENQVEIADENSFKEKPPEWVFICTPHDIVNDWVSVVAQWGSKILIEKPLGRTHEESKDIFSHSQFLSQIYVGFNYRFFDGISRLSEDILCNKFGQIISINMMLGHGGKPNDDKTWKLDPIRGGYTSLLDPGIHFLDLLNYWFPRRAIPLLTKSWSGFWKTGIKEEVHTILDINGAIVNLQTSVVKWKNQFRIEVNGVNGYGVVEGRGKNYGLQTYYTGKRWGWMEGGLPQNQTEILETTDLCLDSFYKETKSLITSPDFNASAYDTLDVMRLYGECLEVMK